MSTQIDEIRNNTLREIEKTESRYKLAFIGAAVIEGLLIAAFLLHADFSNPTHFLLLIVAVAIYTIMGCGLFALGMHVNRNTLRVLRAIETIGNTQK